MLTINIEELKQNLLKKYQECAKKYNIPEAKYMDRYKHSLGVFEMALELNNLYNWYYLKLFSKLAKYHYFFLLKLIVLFYNLEKFH